MRIDYGKQINIIKLEELSVDLFLFANNHEERSLSLFNRLNSQDRLKKSIGLHYDTSSPKKSENAGFIIKTIKNIQQLKILLDDEFANLSSESINIVVDYSCMTKPWYYTIIIYLHQKKLLFNQINCYFSYTPSKFSPPLQPKPNTEIGPLPGKYIVPTDKPKALIVCLGYEKNKAEGLIDHLDPKTFYLMYSKPAIDDKFVRKVEENNSDLIKMNPEKVITFPLNNLIKLEREITSLYYLLRDEYNVIIAPLGPKPFSLISMILSVRHKDIDIWRVGSGSDINEYKRSPIDNNTFIISKIRYIQNKPSDTNISSF